MLFNNFDVKLKNKRIDRLSSLDASSSLNQGFWNGLKDPLGFKNLAKMGAIAKGDFADSQKRKVFRQGVQKDLEGKRRARNLANVEAKTFSNSAGDLEQAINSNKQGDIIQDMQTYQMHKKLLNALGYIENPLGV